MEYTVTINRNGETVYEQIFEVESNVTDPGGRYTLSKADVKTKTDTFARAVEFAAQSHANMLHVGELVSSQTVTAQAKRALSRAETLRRRADEAISKAQALAAQVTEPSTEATASA